MASSAYDRFMASMVLDFEKWHDGVGYDISALAELDSSERRTVEAVLLARGVSDWRDLEALDALGSEAAVRAIVGARTSSDSEVRMAAHEYGPEPSAESREAAIVKSLEEVEPFAGLSRAIDLAIEFPTLGVIAALHHCVEARTGVVAYQAAAALTCIFGKSDSLYDDRHRPVFLRLVGPISPDRTRAMDELRSLLEN